MELWSVVVNIVSDQPEKPLKPSWAHSFSKAPRCHRSWQQGFLNYGLFFFGQWDIFCLKYKQIIQFKGSQIQPQLLVGIIKGDPVKVSVRGSFSEKSLTFPILDGTSAHSQQFLLMLRLGSKRLLLPSFPLAASWHCAGIMQGRGCPCPFPGPGFLGQAGGCSSAGDVATTLAHSPIRWVAIAAGKGCRDVLVRKRAGKQFSARFCAGKSCGPHQGMGVAIAVCVQIGPQTRCCCWNWLSGDCSHLASDFTLVRSSWELVTQGFISGFVLLG